MLKTLFIATLVVLPLAVAIVLIAYRARYFVLGIAAIVFVAMLMWAGIRIAAMFDKSTDAGSAGPARTSISCVERSAAEPPLDCGL
jgi:hypothetical protein